MTIRIPLIVIQLFTASFLFAQHPNIMLTKKNVEAVREGVTKYPLLKSSYLELKADADKAINTPINVPVPADGGGGVTHEQHKNNYKNVWACGMIYQITKDDRYAKYVKDVLTSYAKQYNSWPQHPKRKEAPGGKLFWQNLNDCVWEVYMIQGYDCVYDYMSATDRKFVEDSLFVPVVNQLMVVNSKIFNLIHNHGTWNAAAVGMTGYVLGRKDWVEAALYGSQKDGTTGFMKQLDDLFSPDGYFTEGPYYERYALHPFILFAKAIQQHQPDLKIYAYRDSMLKKAVETNLQCTYTNKAFIPVNDAMKDKTYESEELVYGVDLAYSDMNISNDMLDIANQQKRVIVSDAGLKVAQAIAAGKAKPFVYKTLWISDGAKGDKGGMGLLRSGNNDNETLVVLKATSQGMGHGHFDRLNVLLYNNNIEVFSDYGSARFLNIETKSGGGYTKENNTWAKQTVAHNTITVDKRCMFKGSVAEAEKYSPQLIYFNNAKTGKVVSAKETHAYEGVDLTRTAILFKPDDAQESLVIDVLKAGSNAAHQYDLPFWYQGHIVNTTFSIANNNTALKAMGKEEGYRHLWLNATGKLTNDNGCITVLNNNKFYSTTFLADTSLQVQFVTTGANDPDFNLRTEKAFILSKPQANNQTFINITESHGKTDPIAEYTVGFMTSVKDLKMISDTEEATSFQFTYKNTVYTITLNYKDKGSFIEVKR
ncbi:heparinase II/III family protein [Chitinophagaceae bacterium LWZ2-11]